MITYTIKVDEDTFPYAPGTPVLLRNTGKDQWILSLFAYCQHTLDGRVYVSVGDGEFLQCIPHKGNENLLKTGSAVAGTPCTLKPLQPVLVRDSENEKWRATLFSHYSDTDSEYKYECAYSVWVYCIPYAGNEHLVGLAARK